MGLHQTVIHTWHQAQIRPATITLRPGPPQHPRGLQHRHMMGDQIRRQVQLTPDVTWRHVAENQAVHYRQPGWVAERRVHAGPPLYVHYLSNH